jgi:hypothetical protein
MRIVNTESILVAINKRLRRLAIRYIEIYDEGTFFHCEDRILHEVTKIFRTARKANKPSVMSNDIHVPFYTGCFVPC